MDKSIYQTAEERRAYINSIRSTFKDNSPPIERNYRYTKEETPEEEPAPNTLGIRTVIAILIFAAFIYCDKEKITYQDYSTKEVFSQIEWNPLPLEEIEEYVQSP